MLILARFGLAALFTFRRGVNFHVSREVKFFEEAFGAFGTIKGGAAFVMDPASVTFQT